MTRTPTRRVLLRTMTAGGAGVVAVSSLGTGVASADQCDEFSCTEGTYVKYELVELEDGTCEFQEETDTGIFSDSLRITEIKDGDTCEPTKVCWDDSEYEVNTLTAKAGNDCETVDSPNGCYESTLENNGGNIAAISNLQFCAVPADELECPAGTRSVARYDVDGTDLVFDGGEDVVEFSNKMEDEMGNLTGFDFVSTDGGDDNTEPETLTTVTVEYGSTIETFEVDPDFDVDKQSGSVSVDGSIDRVLFCQAVYAQADFVTGDPIEDLCNNQYGSDKISSVTWSSYNGQLDGVSGQFDGEWTFNNDGSLTVKYDPADYDQKVSLAVYTIEDPVFQDNNSISFSDTRCRQTLFKSDTDGTDSQDGTLTVQLPSP